MGILDTIMKPFRMAGDSLDRTNNQWRDVDPRGDLRREGTAASDFANRAEHGFATRGTGMQYVADRLDKQARGDDLQSTAMLNAALQKIQNQQRSAVSGAAPSNQAMAARNAMRNMADASAGAAGDAARAGIMERHSANQALGALLGNMRAQDLQAILGSRGQGINAFGTIEGARTGRFQGATGVPTQGESMLGLGMGLANMTALSDEREKHSVGSGTKATRKLMDALKPYTYKYRKAGQPGRPTGQQVGIMAQDLERAMPSAVVDTVQGKVIDGARLATGLAGAVADLHKRVKRQERKSANG